MILVIIAFCLIIPQSFALDNSTSDDFSLDDETDEVLTSNNIDDSVEISSDDDTSAKRNNITLFVVSDSPGTNILDAASSELFDSHNMSSVNLVIRNGEQIKI